MQLGRSVKPALSAQILILTGTDSPFDSDDARRAGAAGYLRKERGVEELRQVFHAVASPAATLGAQSTLRRHSSEARRRECARRAAA
jgi:DNA-binding NarL/FixJ family response regulator